MKHLLAIASLCGIAACGTPTPPPPPPPPPAVAQAQPAEAPPEKKAPEPAPKKPVPPKSSAKPATPAKAPPAPAPKAETVAKAPTPAPPAPAAKPAPLDLKSLEQRLKDSNAIGVMTKLSLKNQVDDLVGKFRAYHNGERPPTLPQLRPAFELLLMKVLSLLQDKDPALAHDIDASREAIWSVLSDRARFEQFT